MIAVPIGVEFNDHTFSLLILRRAQITLSLMSLNANLQSDQFEDGRRNELVSAIVQDTDTNLINSFYESCWINNDNMFKIL